MISQLSGIFVIVLCVFIFWMAWKQQRKQNWLLSISLLILGGVLLRVFTSFDLFLHPWDERYHALVAKNLLQHPFIPTLYDNPILPFDFKNWTNNHIWLHKQPLSLWVMALSFKLFGVNIFALRLPSMILSSMGIILTYQIGKILYNHRIGFISAFLFAIHGLIIEVGAGRVATDHIDLFFLFFIELSVYFALLFSKKEKPIYNIFFALSLSAALLSKYLPALIVLPLWLLFLMENRNIRIGKIVIQFSLIISLVIALVLPWQIYINTSFPLEAKWESLYNFRHLTKVIEGQTGTWFYHFNRMRILYGELIYLPLLWLLYKGYKNKRNLKRWALLIWILIPFIFFSFAKTKMQGYTLFTAPALFILTALFWDYLFRFRNKFKCKWLINIVLILLLALPIRYSIERIKPFNTREIKPQWVDKIKKQNRIPHGKKAILFNTEKPIETMFWSDFTAYKNIPDKAIILNLLAQGYEIFIIDNNDVADEIRQINGIKIIGLEK